MQIIEREKPMIRLLVVLMTILALGFGATRITAQEEEPCPAGDDALLATPSASPMASPVWTPTGSPTVEPKASPTATATVSPTVEPTVSPTAAETCVVEIRDFAFMPAVIEIPAGTSVIWINRDGAGHTATADDFSWDTGVLGSNQSSDPIAFDTPGDVPYHCDRHPDFMFGLVRVP
jgi:plastocyanin